MEKTLPLPKIEGETYVHQAWPAWCYGPNGESEVFETEGDVPAGWKMPDGKTKSGKAAAAPVAATSTPSGSEGEELDADGTPWNPDLHAATKTKTSAGLWRMKVGVSRPPKAAGGDTPPLDL